MGGGGASDVVCQTGVDASGGSAVTIMCEATAETGRYVTMSSPTEMVLCEAEVLVFAGAPCLKGQLA